MITLHIGWVITQIQITVFPLITFRLHSTPHGPLVSCTVHRWPFLSAILYTAGPLLSAALCWVPFVCCTLHRWAPFVRCTLQSTPLGLFCLLHSTPVGPFCTLYSTYSLHLWASFVRCTLHRWALLYAVLYILSSPLGIFCPQHSTPVGSFVCCTLHRWASFIRCTLHCWTLYLLHSAPLGCCTLNSWAFCPLRSTALVSKMGPLFDCSSLLAGWLSAAFTAYNPLEWWRRQQVLILLLKLFLKFSDTKPYTRGFTQLKQVRKNSYIFVSTTHRWRIKTDEKAKVVAAIWGTELIQLVVAPASLHQDDSKKGMTSSYFHIAMVQFILFFKLSWCKTASGAKKWTDSAPKAAETTFAFSSVLFVHPYSMANTFCPFFPRLKGVVCTVQRVLRNFISPGEIKMLLGGLMK